LLKQSVCSKLGAKSWGGKNRVEDRGWEQRAGGGKNRVEDRG
jgi:hypothetical protein